MRVLLAIWIGLWTAFAVIDYGLRGLEVGVFLAIPSAISYFAGRESAVDEIGG